MTPLRCSMRTHPREEEPWTFDFISIAMMWATLAAATVEGCRTLKEKISIGISIE